MSYIKRNLENFLFGKKSGKGAKAWDVSSSESDSDSDAADAPKPSVKKAVGRSDLEESDDSSSSSDEEAPPPSKKKKTSGWSMSFDSGKKRKAAWVDPDDETTT